MVYLNCKMIVILFIAIVVDVIATIKLWERQSKVWIYISNGNQAEYVVPTVV